MSLSRRQFVRSIGCAGLLVSSGAFSNLKFSVPAQAKSRSNGVLPVYPLPADLKPSKLKYPLPKSLCLLMDASFSMNNAEFFLQVQGTAEALASDEIGQAVENVGGIHILVAQFSTSAQLSVDHAVLTKREHCKQYAGYVASQSRLTPSYTHIDKGLDFAGSLLKDSPYIGEKQVIDISGDGQQSSDKPSDDEFERKHGEIKGIVERLALKQACQVNGLPIVREDPTLSTYFGDRIITDNIIAKKAGISEGFVEPTTGFGDIKEAMIKKLQRELLI